MFLMVVMGILLVVIVLWVGTLYWRLHSLPERMAHQITEAASSRLWPSWACWRFSRTIHLFWVAGLLLALIDLPPRFRHAVTQHCRFG